MATRLVTVRITVEHREMLRSLLEVQIKVWTEEIQVLRWDLASANGYVRQHRDKEPKRSDYSELLPYPESDYQYAHDLWEEIMHKPQVILQCIRVVQQSRREAHEALASL